MKITEKLLTLFRHLDKKGDEEGIELLEEIVDTIRTSFTGINNSFKELSNVIEKEEKQIIDDRAKDEDTIKKLEKLQVDSNTKIKELETIISKLEEGMI